LAVDLKSLLDRIQVDDASALEDLYQATSPRVFGLISQLAAPEDALDLLQKTYAQIWQRRASLKEIKTDPLHYLLSTARRVTLDAIFDGSAVGRNAPMDDLRNGGVVTPLNGDNVPPSDPLTRALLRSAYLRALDLDVLAEMFGISVPEAQDRLLMAIRLMRGEGT